MKRHGCLYSNKTYFLGKNKSQFKYFAVHAHCISLASRRRSPAPQDPDPPLGTLLDGWDTPPPRPDFADPEGVHTLEVERGVVLVRVAVEHRGLVLRTSEGDQRLAPLRPSDPMLSWLPS